MKQLLLVIMILGLLAGGSGVCCATTFNDPVDFLGSGTNDGHTYMELSGAGDTCEFQYSHNIIFDPFGQNISAVNLIISHKGNNYKSGPNEGWEINDTGGIFSGTLVNSNTGWVDQVFSLPDSLFNDFSGADWTISFKLFENTNGTDKLYIDKSVLTVEYTPAGQANHAPEPSTAILLGFGLIGLAGVGRKKI